MSSIQLTFKLEKAKGYEFMDFNLPYPNRIFHSKEGFVYWTWLIEGFFGTKHNKKYLNDIIARFLITFSEYSPKRINYEQKILQNNTTHKLIEFSGLESVSVKRYIPNRADSFSDHVFWSIKLYAEDYIRKFGYIDMNYLIDWAKEQFQDKEQSTIKAKARNIYFWYEERDFKLKSNKIYSYSEYKDIRISKLKNYARSKSKSTLLKIRKLVKKYKYIVNDIKDNILKLSKLLNVSRNTVYKYILEIKSLLVKIGNLKTKFINFLELAYSEKSMNNNSKEFNIIMKNKYLRE